MHGLKTRATGGAFRGTDFQPVHAAAEFPPLSLLSAAVLSFRQRKNPGERSPGFEQVQRYCLPAAPGLRRRRFPSPEDDNPLPGRDPRLRGRTPVAAL
jgi:hypothetical protein